MIRYNIENTSKIKDLFDSSVVEIPEEIFEEVLNLWRQKIEVFNFGVRDNDFSYLQVKEESSVTMIELGYIRVSEKIVGEGHYFFPKSIEPTYELFNDVVNRLVEYSPKEIKIIPQGSMIERIKYVLGTSIGRMTKKELSELLNVSNTWVVKVIKKNKDDAELTKLIEEKIISRTKQTDIDKKKIIEYISKNRHKQSRNLSYLKISKATGVKQSTVGAIIRKDKKLKDLYSFLSNRKPRYYGDYRTIAHFKAIYEVLESVTEISLSKLANIVGVSKKVIQRLTYNENIPPEIRMMFRDRITELKARDKDKLKFAWQNLDFSNIKVDDIKTFDSNETIIEEVKQYIRTNDMPLKEDIIHRFSFDSDRINFFRKIDNEFDELWKNMITFGKKVELLIIRFLDEQENKVTINQIESYVRENIVSEHHRVDSVIYSFLVKNKEYNKKVIRRNKKEVK